MYQTEESNRSLGQLVGKPMNILLKTVLLIVVSCGLLQTFLLSGFLWNALFPLILFASFILFVQRKSIKLSKYNTILFLTLSGLIFYELTHRFALKERLCPPLQDVQIKVLTYNVFFKNKSPKQSLELIKAANPDIFLIQELTPEWSEHIHAQFRTTHPYTLEIPRKGTHGIGIYSKYTLKHNQTLVNSNKLPFAQIAEASIKGTRVQIVNTHLASPAVAIEDPDQFVSHYCKNYKTRSRQLKMINDATLNTEQQYDCQLLVGDLNTMKYEPIFKDLMTNWVNTYAKKGAILEANFPNSSRVKPIITLDYILARGHATLLTSEVIEGGSSDHLAILSTLEI